MRTALPAGREDNVSGKLQQTFAAEGMEILLARPGVISDSWIMTGTCCPLPARTTGTETKPPLENITSGSRILISLSCFTHSLDNAEWICEVLDAEITSEFTG